MQRKLEPLPGLSNVTGKYTKKCTDEPYPRQVNKVKPEITGVHCANTPSAVLSLNSSSSTSQSRQDSAGGSNCLSVAHRTQNTYAPKSQFTAPKSTSAHSSILFSESHTSTGSKIRTHKSSIPIKPQDIPRTKTRMKEVVKSSSSGSVCKLQSKPTGVIIATPCSPLVNEQGLTRSFESFHLNDRVASSNSLGGSEESSHPNSDTTPFVMRKDHGQGMTSGPCNVLSGSYGSGDGDSSAKDQLYDQPCFVQSPCRLNAMKDSPATVNPQCFLKRFSDSQGAYSSDVRQFYNLPGPEYCITNTLNTIPVHAWASKDLINGPSYPHGEQRLCHPGWQEIRDSNEVSRKVSAQLYGLQPRQGSWGIGMSQGTELSASGMPGPQCTQSALEHYLSDLIADEQRFMAGSPCNAFGYSFCGTATGCGNQSSIAASGENGKKTCSIDLLHFLEQRIENALRSMTSFDSKQYIHPSAHVRVRPNRSASLNPVLDSRINSIEFPLPLGNVCQNQPGPDNDDDVQNSSFYENLVNLQNTQCIGSYPSRHFDCAHTESNMLQQFNTDELQYLLKAVKDLVALRTNPSTGTSSSQGQEGSRFGEMDKQKKTIKTERVDTCTISGKDDQSTYGRSGTESPYITRSVSSSRSSSAVRNNRFDTSSESRGSRVSSGVSEDGSHSNADLMHQRLPIGFQHFERYLDSKFGPDRPTNNVSANSSEMQAKPELCAKSTRSSAGHSPSLLSGNLSDHNPQLITRQRAPSSIALHSGINNINTSGASKVGNNTDHSSVPAVSQYPIYFNESSHPFSTTSQSGQTDKNSEERTVATGITCASASSQHGDFIPSSNTVNSHNSGYLPVPSMNCASSYTGSPEGNISHMNCYTDSSNTHCSDPQAGQVTPWPPNWYQWYVSSHMFPQRLPSYSHYPYHHYYYPHLKQYQQPPTPQQLQQQFCLDFSVCAHKMNRLVTPLSYAMNPPSSYSTAAHLCYMDTNHAHVVEGTYASPLSEGCPFVSYEPQSTENPLPPSGVTGGFCACTNMDGMKRFANVNCNYSDRIPTNSYMFYRPSGVYSPPPGHPYFPCMNTVRCDPFSYSNNNNPENYNWNIYFQRPGYSRFSSCIPRSGSANAGFTYSLETDNSSNHAADRGIAPEFERFRQNNNRWDNYYVGNGNTQISMPSEQTTDLQNFIHYNNNNVLQTPALRPMTNSFSANDLAAYHSQSRIGIRYTKSSFDLAPELPVEPGLALSDHSNFYSKISSLIEMDNDVRLILPNGWSERRSSLGRSYYTCDSTRRSTWNHPLVGPWIPLGWERVDSSQAGVYYQNLLIPHCQRHHPNLWISSLLKDPEVERKSFFTDLRKLQLSLRHSLSACHAEVGAYKNANTEQEQYFINRFRHLKLESLMEIIYSLDQLFYQDLHILIVSFEQERMSIVSHMFAIQPPERTFPQFTES
ncbi:unnamed protein product [Heterobilharzia americana]|nr:unnamed protein product [Heterobilharzia americana]